MNDDPKTNPECPICSIKNGRLETGPLKPPGDWSGVFIRGDNAMHYGMHLTYLLDQPENDSTTNYAVLRDLAETLMSVDERIRR